MQWIIVSFEHNAFWAENRCGYTKLIHQAGRYSFEEAKGICARANIAQPADDPHEVMVVAPEVLLDPGRPVPPHGSGP